ncbi:MAG: alpha/beta hydrolase fold domain-containing protein [Bacteroidales bacterium]|nr:alpha/beta hydrolase fold domain-containing protein [Bacteroidales bacterium]
MKRRSIVLMAAVALAAACNTAKEAVTPVAPEPEVYSLYEGAAPGWEGMDYPEVMHTNPGGSELVLNVTKPTLTVYRPSDEINTGAAFVIAPGGGNKYLTWNDEGTMVAKWLQAHGVTGIILKYRTDKMGNTEEEVEANLEEFYRNLFSRTGGESSSQERPAQSQQRPVTVEPSIQGQDGLAAMKYVRSHSSQWGIDPDKIGIMGFSAGAIVTLQVEYFHDASSKPNIVAPIYGAAIRGDELPSDPSPVFFCAPEFDFTDPTGLFNLYMNYMRSRLPAEFHLIHGGTHGDGLKDNGNEWNEWIELLCNYMKQLEMI